MVEVKADALEESFEAFQDEDDGVASLKAELETLKAKIAAARSTLELARALVWPDGDELRMAGPLWTAFDHPLGLGVGRGAEAVLAPK